MRSTTTTSKTSTYGGARSGRKKPLKRNTLCTARRGEENPLTAIGAPLPRTTFPSDGLERRVALEILEEELLIDGNSKQNLATFCQSYASEEVLTLMEKCLDKNLIDKDEYPQTARIEERCVTMLAELWNAPPGTPTGCSTIGSSEASMLGGMAAKWRWREKRRKVGKSTDAPNMVCGAVQICWHKFAKYWDIELREVPMTKDNMKLSPEDVVAQCDENTIMVVPTAGITYHGLYDDVQAISAALDTLHEEKGIDVPIHVDGASGAFLLPFTDPDHSPWDFRLERVKSINASGHKFGLAPLGTGWCVFREKEDLPEDLIFHVSYLGGDMPTFQINFSRPAGQVIAQYFNFGRQGYGDIHLTAHAIALYLSPEIEKLGFEIIHDGSASKGIPCVVWTLPEDSKAPYSLHDVEDRMRMRGWQVPAYPFTGYYEHQSFQRILIRRDFTRELGDIFLEHLKESVTRLSSNPNSKPLTTDDLSSYRH